MTLVPVAAVFPVGSGCLLVEINKNNIPSIA
jgi:hypothetical protein